MHIYRIAVAGSNTDTHQDPCLATVVNQFIIDDIVAGKMRQIDERHPAGKEGEKSKVLRCL